MKMYNHQGLAAVLSFLLPGLGQIYVSRAPWAALFFAIHGVLLYLLYRSIFDYFIEPGKIALIATAILMNIAFSSFMAHEQACSHNEAIHKLRNKGSDLTV